MIRPLSRRALGRLAAALAIAWLRPGPVRAARQATPTTDAALAALPAPGSLPAGQPRAAGPLRVVATTGILADIAANIGGERIAARSVLPANADPHEFEPTPADIVAAADADLLIEHGLGLDAWAERLLQNARPGLPTIVASDGVHTLTLAEEEADRVRPPDEGHGHDSSAVDPHWWFDPIRTIGAVEFIAAGLVAVDPAGEPTYRARAAAYAQQLRDLDAAIARAIDTIPPARRKLVTNHDAIAYYADRYGLTLVGTIIPGLETTAEPSAREVAALLDEITRVGVSVIFSENTTSPRLAQSLADEAGIRVVDDLYTDNLGPPGSGADTYQGLLRTDTVIIVEALR